MKTEIKKISPELDDEAFRIGDFIQELAKVQDQYFEELFQKAKDNKWFEGMEEDDFKEWLFDYCFNGTSSRSNEIDKSFSEHCYADCL